MSQQLNSSSSLPKKKKKILHKINKKFYFTQTQTVNDGRPPWAVLAHKTLTILEIKATLFYETDPGFKKKMWG